MFMFLFRYQKPYHIFTKPHPGLYSSLNIVKVDLLPIVLQVGINDLTKVHLGVRGDQLKSRRHNADVQLLRSDFREKGQDFNLVTIYYETSGH